MNGNGGGGKPFKDGAQVGKTILSQIGASGLLTLHDNLLSFKQVPQIRTHTYTRTHRYAPSNKCVIHTYTSLLTQAKTKPSEMFENTPDMLICEVVFQCFHCDLTLKAVSYLFYRLPAL